LTLSPASLDRFDHREGNDEYVQPANLFKIMSESQKQQLASNIAASLSAAREEIQERMLQHFNKVSEAYGNLVKTELGKQ
jgi:catalase